MSIFKEHYELWEKLSGAELEQVQRNEAQISTDSEAFKEYKNDYVKRIELMHLPVSEQPDHGEIVDFLKRNLAVEMLKKENSTVNLKLMFYKSQTKLIIIGVLLLVLIICIIIFFTVSGFTSQLVSGLIGILSLGFIAAAIFTIE